MPDTTAPFDHRDGESPRPPTANGDAPFQDESPTDDAVRRLVAEHPFIAVALAIAAGFLVGRLLR